MKLTRSITVSLCALALALPTLAAAQTKNFTETVPLDAGGRLHVDGSKGSISLTAWERNEVEIRARIEAPSNVDGDYAKRAVEATTVRVEGSGSSVEIRSDYSEVPERSGRWNGKSVPEIHYEIRAPKNLRLSVDSDRGPASITGFEGEIEIDVDRGEVDLRELTGRIAIDIDRGSDSRMSSIRGSFVVDADRTNLRMRDIRIESDSRLDIDRGDVEIGIESSQGLNLRTDLSRRADFETELPLTMSSLDGRDFEGTINGGGPELYIGSDRGSIRLHTDR